MVTVLPVTLTSTPGRAGVVQEDGETVSWISFDGLLVPPGPTAIMRAKYEPGGTFGTDDCGASGTVSYTHLTLPTSDLV